MPWNPFEAKPSTAPVAGRNRLCATCGKVIHKGARMVPSRPVESEHPVGLYMFPKADGTCTLERTYSHPDCVA